jgi:hypothetical protein
MLRRSFIRHLVVRSAGLAMLLGAGVIFVPAYASGVPVDLTVSLDPALQDLIQRYPENIRIQATRLLQDALPLIKTSADEYLKEVNEKIEHLMFVGQCKGSGLSAEFAGQFKLLTRDSLNPTQDFRTREREQLAQLNQTSTAVDFSDKYLDIYHAVSVELCRMQLTEEEQFLSSRALRDEETKYRDLSYVWSGLRGRCNEIRSCIGIVRSDVQSVIRKSDKQDLKTTEIAMRFSRISDPPKEGFFARFTVQPYSDEILQLYKLGQDIHMAKLRREYIAGSAIESVQQAMSQMEVYLLAGDKHLVPQHVGICLYVVSSEELEAAKNQARAAITQSADIDGELATATTVDPERAEQIATLRSEVAQKLQHAKNIVDTPKKAAYTDPNCTIH